MLIKTYIQNYVTDYYILIIILSHCKFASLSLIAKRITFKRKKWHSGKKLHYHRSSLSALFAPLITTALLYRYPFTFFKGDSTCALITVWESERKKKKSLCWRNYLDRDRTNWRRVASHGWISFCKIIRKRLTHAARRQRKYQHDNGIVN